MTRFGRLALIATMMASLTVTAALALGACEKKPIPARTAKPDDPQQYLTGGTLQFEETFAADKISDKWTIDAGGDWRVVDGWVHSRRARNKGLWLTGLQLPDKVRVEFDVRSEPRGEQRFEGDTKCEVFATEPAHEKGYILVNGGWNNALDIIARLDEHGKDRKERPSRAVEASKVYRWAIVRVSDTVYWFRDGGLFMYYQDANPVPGRYFAFNNWEAHLYFDNLRIYAL